MFSLIDLLLEVLIMEGLIERLVEEIVFKDVGDFWLCFPAFFRGFLAFTWYAEIKASSLEFINKVY